MSDNTPDVRPHGDPIVPHSSPDEDERRPDPDAPPSEIPAPEPIDKVGVDDDPGAGAD
jgi:hypothetical protein